MDVLTWIILIGVVAIGVLVAAAVWRRGRRAGGVAVARGGPDEGRSS